MTGPPAGQDGIYIPPAPQSGSADGNTPADVDSSTNTGSPAGQDGTHVPPAPSSGSADGSIPADVDSCTIPGPPGGQYGTAAQSAEIPTEPISNDTEQNMEPSMDDIILIKADVTKAHRRIKVCRK